MTSNQYGENVYSRKRNNSNQITMKFTHLILSRFHSVTNRNDNSHMVYIMESHNQNNNSWSKNINHGYYGSISIGYYICLPCPLTIEKYMGCNIPMIKYHDPVILLKHHKIVHTFPMNE